MYDTQHLSFGVGRYIAGLTVAQSLIPQDMQKTAITWPSVKESPSVGILPEEYSVIARKAVENAMQNPYKITPISGYDTDPAYRICDTIEGADFTGSNMTDKESVRIHLETQIQNLLASWENVDYTLTIHDYSLDNGILWNLDADVTVRIGYTTDTAQISVTEGTNHRYGEWIPLTIPTADSVGIDQRVCEKCGHVQSVKVEGAWQKYDLADHLQELPDSFCSQTNLWDLLEPEEVMLDQHGEWKVVSKYIHSVTIPLSAGERVLANSFIERGIQVSFIGDYGIIKTYYSNDTKRAYQENGCLIAPEGTIAVNIPVWDYREENELYILSAEHNYTSVATAPKCTEQGYTTYTCECGDGYVDEYVDATGHSYPTADSVGIDQRVCEKCGYVQVESSWQKYDLADHLQELPDSFCSQTNLWDLLEPEEVMLDQHGEWKVVSKYIHSVTIPLSAGERVLANSFIERGIQVSFIGDYGIIKTYYSNDTKRAYQENGCLIAPEGTIAVNIPVWDYREENELYILSAEHNYTSVATAPKCTEQGYTTYTCECGDSYVDEYVDATGHSYINATCSFCSNYIGPVITMQPTNGEAKLGERYCVEVKAEGEGLKYQWYLRNAGTKSFSKSSVTDNTYDDVMTVARADREVYCVITDTHGNKVTTNTVKLIRLPSEELAITEQPKDASAKLNEEFCVTVEAKGDGLKYQWYWRNVGSEKWNISGQRDNTYDDVMTFARHNREVQCVITDAFGNTVTTDIATITGTPTVTLAITSQPQNESAKLGEMFCVTVEAKGDYLKYQWYWRNVGSENWNVSGQRDNTYDDVMTKARHNREVYCVISDMWGNKVSSEIATITGTPSVALEIISQPTDGYAAMGEKYCVEVKAQGDNLTYTWYFKNKGSNVWNKSGVTDNTYDDVMTQSRAGRAVYCVITDSWGNQVTTNVVTLNVIK